MMASMVSFASYDGTRIGYRVVGDGVPGDGPLGDGALGDGVRGGGRPLVCLPGGPGRAGEYLGDLGGLGEKRRLVIPDARGVGLSADPADPADPATFRADRQTEDVEALRVHLGLERMDLLAHSAGAVLAILYAAGRPDRVAKLVLVTPGLAPLGIDDTEEDFRAALALREHEPWYAEAIAAMRGAEAGDRSMQTFRATRPFYYGRWSETARQHAMIGVSERHQAARNGFLAGVAFDPPATRSAIGKLTAPVLLYGGGADPTVTPAVVREAASLFAGAMVVIQPGAGHFPWIEDPGAFAAAVSAFLG